MLLLGIGVLVAGGLLALTHRERNEALVQVKELQEKAARLEATSVAVRKERDSAQTELKRVQERLVETTKKLESAVAAASVPPARSGNARSGQVASSGSGTGPAKPMKALAEMMKNPAMKEMVKQQQIAQLEMQYAGLMSKFQLNDEEKANFKQLLAERLQLEGEVGLQMMDDSLTPEQRRALMQQITDSKNASNEKIKTFLNNDEDYGTFQHWEESKPERMQLNMGQSLFAAAGEPLSQAQEQQLVETMYTIRTMPKNTPDLNRPENINPANLSSSEIDRQLVNYDADAKRVYQEAARYLSPRQLESLKTMQQQWRAMQEAGLRMSSAMMGGKK